MAIGPSILQYLIQHDMTWLEIVYCGAVGIAEVCYRRGQGQAGQNNECGWVGGLQPSQHSTTGRREQLRRILLQVCWLCFDRLSFFLLPAEHSQLSNANGVWDLGAALLGLIKLNFAMIISLSSTLGNCEMVEIRKTIDHQHHQHHHGKESTWYC